ncbi:MAG: family 2A encapsulin nanocompartment shell protein [Frankiaceae bacterium]
MTTETTSQAPGIHRTLSEAAASLLSNTTKSAPQWSAITPRWLASLLPWQPVEAGAYRVNRVADGPEVIAEGVECSPDDASAALPESFVDYAPNPREYRLNAVTAVLEVQTRVTDIHNVPHDQVREQLRLTVEKVKESQDDQLINNEDYGLLNQVAPSFSIPTRAGAPTPDDLDELLALVWKQPSFFLAHPRAIAAFGRECTRRGVPPVLTSLFGAQFITWRGVPLIPTDKLAVTGGKDGTTNILLVRTGLEKQGVVGLFQPGVPGEIQPSLSVRFMGIDLSAVASYLVTLYCSVAVHTQDALAALHGVEVDRYHDFA